MEDAAQGCDGLLQRGNILIFSGLLNDVRPIQNRLAFSGEYFIDRYGKEAAMSAPPVRKMLALGIPVGLGTDATRVSSHNPWLSLYWITTGKTVGGTVMLGEDNRLTRGEALKLFTVGSAW